ncbi:hypothetical protein OG866_23170 [Streptomyces sp. NBC_00663]|uniref:hypothetical protein n=1 Tax=Streptomyces sp. NBC_00663 TaxID=2975801 RepID=UPI002E3805FB|nr:hypothetical protein [Streptomyces sp. NBC_00663]
METAELLGELCRQLPVLREYARQTGDSVALEEILAAARRGEPVIEGLRELGLLRVLAMGERVEPRNASEWSGGAMVALPGADHSGRLAYGDYRCPAGSCSRAEQPRPGDDLPVCALHGRPLSFG